MVNEPVDLDQPLLRSLGLDGVVRAETIRERHGHSVVRLRTEAESFVLKVWPRAESASELRHYSLLEQLGVPTVRVIATTDRALLLEDLATSPRWRLADDDDLASPSMIAGLARWYQLLHNAGSHLGRRAASIPGEYDHLSAATLHRTGRFLGLDHTPAWIRAIEVIERLTDAWRRLPLTLIYNDFHVSNLAIGQRRAGDNGTAVMIDFHLLRSGTRASDLRNVTGQLGTAEAVEFRRCYGPVAETERIIHAPLAVIGALCLLDPAVAKIPRWARSLCDQVGDGRLDASIDAALGATPLSRI